MYSSDTLGTVRRQRHRDAAEEGEDGGEEVAIEVGVAGVAVAAAHHHHQ